MTKTKRLLIACGAICTIAGCKPPTDEYPLSFVPALAAAAANPAAQKPKATKDDKSLTVYSYDTLPGVAGVGNVVLTVAKDHKSATKLAFDTTGPSPKKMGAWSFAAKGESTVGDLVSSEWGEIKGGPFSGSAVHVDNSGLSAQIYTPAFFLSSAAGVDNDEARMRRWACGSGRTDVKAMAPAAFIAECKTRAEAHSLAPMRGTVDDVLASRECDYVFRSDAPKLMCLYTAKTNKIETRF